MGERETGKCTSGPALRIARAASRVVSPALAAPLAYLDARGRGAARWGRATRPTSGPHSQAAFHRLRRGAFPNVRRSGNKSAPPDSQSPSQAAPLVVPRCAGLRCTSWEQATRSTRWPSRKTAPLMALSARAPRGRRKSDAASRGGPRAGRAAGLPRCAGPRRSAWGQATSPTRVRGFCKKKKIAHTACSRRPESNQRLEEP